MILINLIIQVRFENFYRGEQDKDRPNKWNFGSIFCSGHEGKNFDPVKMFEKLTVIHLWYSMQWLVRKCSKVNSRTLLKWIKINFACMFNPYPGFFGTINERVLWKKIQIHHWWRHSWDLENKNYMYR